MELREHPMRADLVAELHARPPELLVAPLMVSYLAMVSPPAAREDEWRHFCALLTHHGVTPPARLLSHASYDLGPFRVKFERHSEFARYVFMAPLAGSEPFEKVALSLVPADWLRGLGGEIITATHVELRRDPASQDEIDRLAAAAFGTASVTGADIGGDAGRALTHFELDAAGFGRLLVFDRSMTPRQSGRMVQRLLEMDTYRMMSLLALPVARELGPFLTECEQELAQVTAMLQTATSRDENSLLDRLTRLEASIENRTANNEFRFGASTAYSDLVARRIAELREQRIHGLPTFQEFNDRRLAPAMATCQTMMRRQESLSARVARANQLLATRVDITREEQNQALLASMDRRASVQLRLQQTVEGLSIAAFTYYVVGLIGYLAKAAKAAGHHVEPELLMGLSVPFVIVVAAIGIRRIRQAVERAARAG
jgi:uncharacterized membrane-anchored protein